MIRVVFKLNISEKGRAWKLETDANALIGKSVGDIVNGGEMGPEFEGYEFEITGGSDNAGFPMYKKAEGIGLKRVLLTDGWGMHKKPRGVKKKMNTPKGLRLRKTVRGREISEAVTQINIKVIKAGNKKLGEIFPEQNKIAESEVKVEEKKEEAKLEAKVEEKVVGKKEKVKEEKKVEAPVVA